VAGFSAQLALLVEKAKGDIETVHRMVCLQLYDSVVRKSPVGNPSTWLSLRPYTDLKGKEHTALRPPPGYVGGRFRANWQVGVGAVNTDTSQPPNADADAVIDRAEGTIKNVTVGGVIYLTNSLPYSLPLEYGHSHQTPNGMVRLTVQEYAQYLERAVRSVKK
jgi:hypothetical protein